MKKILLMLPLLFWLGCEDESEESFSLVDEWVQCARLSLDIEYDDGTTATYDYQWDGLSVDVYRDGSLYSFRLYNNYGSQLYNEYVDGYKYYYEYEDGWKMTRSITIDAYGDTLVDNSTYTWDGLTLTYNIPNSGVLITQIHNSYGRTLLLTHANDSNGQELRRYEHTYKEDGRRKLDYKDYADTGLRQYIYEWDGNTYERKNYLDGELYSKYIGEINEHGYTIIEERYSCEDEDNCTWLYTREYEYDCDNFDPIPN